MTSTTHISTRTKILFITITSLVIISIVAFLNYQRLDTNASRLPQDIRSEIAFSPYLIEPKTTGMTVGSYQLTTMDDNVQLLSYVVALDDTSVTISEYPQPPQFTDIPEYKERFLTNIIKQYATVQTANGTVYLGRQTKQQNKQLAIMLERGLVVLMNPAKDLSDAQWRTLGESLEIQKIRQ